MWGSYVDSLLKIFAIIIAYTAECLQHARHFLSIPHLLAHLILTIAYNLGYNTITCMKTWRHKEVISLAQGHQELSEKAHLWAQGHPFPSVSTKLPPTCLLQWIYLYK